MEEILGKEGGGKDCSPSRFNARWAPPQKERGRQFRKIETDQVSETRSKTYNDRKIND
jgi:hypothetical protein